MNRGARTMPSYMDAHAPPSSPHPAGTCAVDGDALRARLSAAALDLIGDEAGQRGPGASRSCETGAVPRPDDRQGAAGDRRRRPRDGPPAQRPSPTR